MPQDKARERFIEFIRSVHYENGTPPEDIKDPEAERLVLRFEVGGLKFAIVHDRRESLPDAGSVMVRAVACKLPEEPVALERLMRAALFATQRTSRLGSGSFALDVPARELHFLSICTMDGLGARAVLPALQSLASAIRTWRSDALSP